MLNTILLIIVIALLICLITITLISIKKKSSVTREDSSSLIRDIRTELLNLKTELNNQLFNTQKAISDNLSRDLENFNRTINEKLDTLTKRLADEMDKLVQNNKEKLDEMRKTVDEKLETTLSNRLTQSFKIVQENLDQVSLGLGEMRNLANDVGDLRKVFSNVKTRGIWGEMQLSQILSELLNKDQYEENVITNPKTKDPVEFAILLPGDGNTKVRLPIDSKFPLDTYTKVIEAYESMDKDAIEKSITNLKQRIKGCAKDIKEKYIAPPYTTDFGIMFLPVEGLYAEVAKTGLIEELQNDFRIIIAGPTTMSALLNSLQVGFRTLAIEQRSSEVWSLLSAVKTEFSTFEKTLKKAQEKLQQADKEIEQLVGTRTRQIQRKLKDVAELDYSDAQDILEIEDGE